MKGQPGDLRRIDGRWWVLMADWAQEGPCPLRRALWKDFLRTRSRRNLWTWQGRHRY